MYHKHKNRGYITILVLVFASVFVVIMSALTGYIFAQNKLQFAKENREKAFHIAEAGLNYYKWRLAHYPDDLQDGTGVSGPYIHSYSDPEGDEIGTFSLQVDGNQQCGSTRSIDITSTGWSKDDPSLTRTITATYARPSVSTYSYIIDSNVWAGSDRIIKGKYHSNRGIRMDGVNKSLVTSSVPNWPCTAAFGCSPDSTENGVFGAGPNSSQWKWSVPQIDFDGISADLADMKTRADNFGLLLSSASPHGYHLVFKSDGNVDVYTVNTVTSVTGWDPVLSSYQSEDHVIETQTLLQTYTPSATCALILAEDRLWIDGTVSGKITVAAADVADPLNKVDIILNGNINYADPTGNTDGLTAISERDILIPLRSPENMTLNGIFIAQTGRFGRHYYWSGEYPNDAMQDTLTINGTIVSAERVGTKWISDGVFSSGYETRESSYDDTQKITPPPLTPYTSHDYGFVSWQEQ